MNWNGKPVKTTGFAVTLAMPLKMNGHIPPEMTGRSNLGTATYINWNVPPEMGDKCQYHLIWVVAHPTVVMSSEVIPCDDQGLSGSEPGGAQPQGLGFDSLRGWRTKRGLRGIEERVGG